MIEVIGINDWKRLGKRYAVFGLAALLCGGAMVKFLSTVPDASCSALVHEVYIWQRAWTPEVADAVKEAGSVADGFCPLSAQISWREGKPLVAWPRVAWQELAATHKRLTVAIRVDPLTADLLADPANESSVCDVADKVLQKAKAAGAEVAELQLDLDAAESQLQAYARWVVALKKHVAPIRVTFTALPSWLHCDAFCPLAKSGDGYVLQVHAAERPSPLSKHLCDATKARRWALEAAHAAPGIPFRVALPTYTYEIAFDANGHRLGVVAEGERKAWPPDSSVVYLCANASELAALCEGWKSQRPAEMTGVIWYRLAVSNDEKNWRWATLRALMQGREPRSSLELQSTASDKGRLLDLTLHNSGEADAEWPREVIASLHQDGFESGDAVVPGMSVSLVDGEAKFAVLPHAGIAMSALSRIIRPGESVALGWLRRRTSVHESPSFVIHECLSD